MLNLNASKNSPALYVAISDIHFNLNNLTLSSLALEAALMQAEELNVPLVIAGDLHDTKAIIRAEVASAIINIMRSARTDVYILVGNHDLVNERGIAHGLEYLEPYAVVIDKPIHFSDGPGVVFIPYQNDATAFEAAVKQKASKGNLIICHQGVKGALMGDYVQDKSAIDVSILKGFPTISGHYHKHQTIGTLTYIGSPFTMTFGEANDGPKGFLIINTDGTFEQVPLDLRRHVIWNMETCKDDKSGAQGFAWAYGFQRPRSQDLVWLKLKGPRSVLDTIKKANLVQFIGHANFKLDKIATEAEALEPAAKTKTDFELLDALIERLAEQPQVKAKLKTLWRELLT